MGNGMSLVQLIVPMTCLAIWGLTWLINQEAKPLPPRVGRPPDQPRPRPTTGTQGGRSTSPNPSGKSPIPFARDVRTPASVGLGGQEGRGHAFDQRQAFEIEERLRQETYSSQPGPAAGSGAGRPGTRPTKDGRPRPRRVNKPKASAPAPNASLNTNTHRALSASMEQASNAQALGNSNLELTPLAMTHIPLSTSTGTKGLDLPTSSAGLAPLDQAGNFRATSLINSPSRLREAIILNEILQPPLALRPRR